MAISDALSRVSAPLLKGEEIDIIENKNLNDLSEEEKKVLLWKYTQKLGIEKILAER